MSEGKLAKLWRADGRVGRIEYWVVNIIVSVLYVIIEPLLYSNAWWVFWLIVIPLAVCQIHIAIKRAHDRNRSFLFIFLFLVPILWLWPLIELGFFPRVDEGNKYGTRAH